MRDNPTASLSYAPNKLGDKNPARNVRGGYTQRERAHNEALPATLSLWDRPTYQPEQGYVRPGATDFLNVRSRGL